uniref:Protein FAM13B n=1 Tax=Magallana gigas TaxID=29159 RepID=K1PJ18_MAGGI
MSSVDKMKKLLSPGTRKKGLGNRTFGVPLEELMSRAASGASVPYVVSKICEHIRDKGFETEGIFRINGSTRIVEKYRTSFDMRGDADLNEEEDLMAVASLLKLFLREIPESLIPENKTQRFIAVQEEYQNNPAGCISGLRLELQGLGEVHYNLLRYLIRFLVVVAQYERTNKMSPICGQGVIGLKDQGKINQIVYKFITNYDALFKEENEISPSDEWVKQKQKAPPRPPPPKLLVEEHRPVPKPRSMVRTDPYDSSSYQDIEDYSEGSSSNTQGRSHSPRGSDDEIAGRASPFVLDRMVENVIARSIKEHLFGDDVSMCETFIEEEEDSKENLENAIPVKDRIKQFESNPHTSEILRSSKTVKQTQPKAELMDTSPTQQQQRMNGFTHKSVSHSSKENDVHQDEDFESVKRDSGTLSSLQFKRPAGPRNRRSPSRRSRSNSLEDKEEIELDTQSRNDNASHELETSTLTDTKPSREREPVPKPRVAFLELTNHTENKSSPDASPSNARKPFIPPLDLSTLHEHIDSSDPIPADKGQSVSYQLAKSQINGGDTPDVVISPRSNKLIKRKSKRIWKPLYPPVPISTAPHPAHFSFTNLFFQPSLADKASKPTVKKWMNDISKAKREIKRLKEEAEIGNRSRHGSGASSSGERLEPPDIPPSMEQTLNIILLKLGDKRRDAKRPEDVDMMNSDQILDEKLAVQKALLHFENLHGRPPREKKELQTVPEDRPIEFEGGFPNPYRPSVRIPTAHYDDFDEVPMSTGLGTLGTMDFAVTRDFSVLRDTVRPESKEVTRKEHSPKVKRKLSLPEEEEEEENPQNQEPNLHEMSMKVQRDDREPLQSEYTCYKLSGDEVLIKMDTVSVCDSDINLHSWNQVAQVIASIPFMPGHECAGTVVKCGPDVKGVAVGARVGVENHYYCGECYQCQHDTKAICKNMDQFGTGVTKNFDPG